MRLLGELKRRKVIVWRVWPARRSVEPGCRGRRRASVQMRRTLMGVGPQLSCVRAPGLEPSFIFSDPKHRNLMPVQTGPKPPYA
jgi:hypothetical protein